MLLKNGIPDDLSILSADISNVGSDTDDIVSDLEIISDHIHGAQKVYPTLANGVTLTGAAGAWALGAKTEIIPASTVASIFDLHFVNIGAVSATDTYEVVFYKGDALSEVEIGRCRVVRTAAQSGTAPVPIMTERLPANTRVSAAVASSSGGSDTLVLSVCYHVY